MRNALLELWQIFISSLKQEDYDDRLRTILLFTLVSSIVAIVFAALTFSFIRGLVTIIVESFK